MGLTKDKASCSLLKDSVVMYYISNLHKVCLWSHEWIKANPFPFLEKQLKAHVPLMVPLSFLCDQQTSFIEHSFGTPLGDRKMNALLKEVKIPSNEAGTHIAKHNTISFKNCLLFLLYASQMLVVMSLEALVYA